MKPEFYRKSKRFLNVKYTHTQIKVSIDSLRTNIAHVIMSKDRKFNDVYRNGFYVGKFDKKEIIKRLGWMNKSRLIGIFYLLNMKDAFKASKEN